jgi:hypothetical protein
MCERCPSDILPTKYKFGAGQVQLCSVCALECGFARRPDSDFPEEMIEEEMTQEEVVSEELNLSKGNTVEATN